MADAKTHFQTMIVLMMLAASIAQAQSTAPTTSATSTPTTAAADFSSPRAAVQSLRVAIDAGDVAALREMIFAPDVDRRLLADAYASVVIAGKHLADAMAARFGATGERIARGGAFSAGDLKAVDQIPIEETGDVAAVQLPGQDGKKLFLRREHAGEPWRIDLLEFAGVSASEDPSAQASLLRSLARGIDTVAVEITEGRYRTLADARAAVVERFHSTIAKSMRATTRTTAPSTTTSPTDQ